MKRKPLALGMIIPLAAAGVLATAPAASANHRPIFSDSDTCNGLRDRLRLTGEVNGPASDRHRDIKLEVTLTTTHNRPHDDWKVTVKLMGADRTIIDETPQDTGTWTRLVPGIAGARWSRKVRP